MNRGGIRITTHRWRMRRFGSWVMPRRRNRGMGYVSEHAEYPSPWLSLGRCFTRRAARRRALLWLGEEALGG